MFSRLACWGSAAVIFLAVEGCEVITTADLNTPPHFLQDLPQYYLDVIAPAFPDVPITSDGTGVITLSRSGPQPTLFPGFSLTDQATDRESATLYGGLVFYIENPAPRPISWRVTRDNDGVKYKSMAENASILSFGIVDEVFGPWTGRDTVTFVAVDMRGLFRNSISGRFGYIIPDDGVFDPAISVYDPEASPPVGMTASQTVIFEVVK
ncbi:MAG: hypothetical protein QGH20_00865 [Candidatus Latescibacteria bacterium]|jgi:hypothetical protein|nr:hypothetical protein [Candidatus Latescibacterota bacterium]